MDNFQKIEQLVNKAGCSYEDAKAALEGCGWDLIDAIISLERDGKVRKEEAAQPEQKVEASVEIVPEIASAGTSGSGERTYTHDAGPAGDQDNAGSSDGAEGAPKRKFRLWARIKGILLNNRMLVFRSSGQQILDLPILIPVIALIAFFWATLIVAVIAMVFGCHFHFEGEDLGKTNINNTMDKATDYAEKVRSDLAGKVNDRQRSDN